MDYNTLAWLARASYCKDDKSLTIGNFEKKAIVKEHMVWLLCTLSLINLVKINIFYLKKDFLYQP